MNWPPPVELELDERELDELELEELDELELLDEPLELELELLELLELELEVLEVLELELLDLGPSSVQAVISAMEHNNNSGRNGIGIAGILKGIIKIVGCLKCLATQLR